MNAMLFPLGRTLATHPHTLTLLPTWRASNSPHKCVRKTLPLFCGTEHAALLNASSDDRSIAPLRTLSLDPVLRPYSKPQRRSMSVTRHDRGVTTAKTLRDVHARLLHHTTTTTTTTITTTIPTTTTTTITTTRRCMMRADAADCVVVSARDGQ